MKIAKMAALPPMNSDKKLRQYQKVLDEVLASNMDMMFSDNQTLKTIKHVEIAQQLTWSLKNCRYTPATVHYSHHTYSLCS